MTHAAEVGAFSKLNVAKPMCQCLKYSNVIIFFKKVIYFYGFKSTAIFFTFSRLSNIGTL